MNIEKISDDWIIILCAIVNDAKHMVECDNVNKKRREMALPIRQTRKQRGLEKITVFKDIQNRNVWRAEKGKLPLKDLPEGFTLKDLPDDEVKIWFALGAEIIDFSCLGAGVRPYIEAIWIHCQNECDNRKIETKFLCDLEMK